MLTEPDQVAPAILEAGMEALSGNGALRMFFSVIITRLAGLLCHFHNPWDKIAVV